MSMPGFYFHFRCRACGHNSDEYPLYVFPMIGSGQLMLPAWSRQLGCYMTIECDLTESDRERCERDPTELARIARTLGNDHVTVGVPRWGEGLAEGEVRVAPPPTCPKCGAPADSVWGYPSEYAK
jgi:hypothetical protein